MNEVFVVYYDVYHPGRSDLDDRVIDCVVDTAEKARARVHDLNKRANVSYADFESFVVE